MALTWQEADKVIHLAGFQLSGQLRHKQEPVLIRSRQHVLSNPSHRLLISPAARHFQQNEQGKSKLPDLESSLHYTDEDLVRLGDWQTEML